MKTADEIPNDIKERVPIYVSGMNVIAKKYKNIPIVFKYDSYSVYGPLFRAVNKAKYGEWLWHKKFLVKEENVQLEFVF